MKKIYVLSLIIFSIILFSVLSDTINAYIFKKSPIISKHEVLDDLNYVDRGVLFDVYYCHHSADVVSVDWVIKYFPKKCPDIQEKYMIDITNNVFVKTYLLEENDEKTWNIKDLDTNDIVNISLDNFNQNFKNNQKYEFVFRITNNKINDNIQSIFYNTEIIEIKETEKYVNQFIR